MFLPEVLINKIQQYNSTQIADMLKHHIQIYNDLRICDSCNTYHHSNTGKKSFYKFMLKQTYFFNKVNDIVGFSLWPIPTILAPLPFNLNDFGSELLEEIKENRYRKNKNKNEKNKNKIYFPKNRKNKKERIKNFKRPLLNRNKFLSIY